jgi:hypothetical protein
MGKKKDDDGDGEDVLADLPTGEIDAVVPPRRRSAMPALSVGDVLAILTLIVLSAALLLEGYHKDFRDYSKEIIALFAIVVGFLLGRKT